MLIFIYLLKLVVADQFMQPQVLIQYQSCSGVAFWQDKVVMLCQPSYSSLYLHMINTTGAFISKQLIYGELVSPYFTYLRLASDSSSVYVSGSVYLNSVQRPFIGRFAVNSTSVGSKLWSQQMLGASQSSGHDMVVSTSSVTLVGSLNGQFTGFQGNSGDIFVATFNKNGTLNWLNEYQSGCTSYAQAQASVSTTGSMLAMITCTITGNNRIQLLSQQGSMQSFSTFLMQVGVKLQLNKQFGNKITLFAYNPTIGNTTSYWIDSSTYQFNSFSQIQGQVNGQLNTGLFYDLSGKSVVGISGQYGQYIVANKSGVAQATQTVAGYSAAYLNVAVETQSRVIWAAGQTMFSGTLYAFYATDAVNFVIPATTGTITSTTTVTSTVTSTSTTSTLARVITSSQNVASASIQRSLSDITTVSTADMFNFVQPTITFDDEYATSSVSPKANQPNQSPFTSLLQAEVRIALGAAGGLVVLLILGTLTYCMCRRPRKTQKSDTRHNNSTTVMIQSDGTTMLEQTIPMNATTNGTVMMDQSSPNSFKAESFSNVVPADAGNEPYLTDLAE